jgi:hypothetical protein
MVDIRSKSRRKIRRHGSLHSRRLPLVCAWPRRAVVVGLVGVSQGAHAGLERRRVQGCGEVSAAAAGAGLLFS